LPGVDEKDLDVTLANGMLTVRGEKAERDEQDKDKLACGGAQLRLVQRDNTPAVRS
jgi:HSP20 family molecular chaperone IbpA